MSRQAKHMPLWLVAAADQRLAKITESVKKLSQVEQEALADICLMAMLTDPAGEDDVSWRDWDHTCDHCGVVDAPDFEVRHISMMMDGPMNKVALTVGACGKCWALQ
jgi:hypothetical protein